TKIAVVGHRHQSPQLSQFDIAAHEGSLRVESILSRLSYPEIEDLSQAIRGQPHSQDLNRVCS
ncbi:MAG: hypothetical protein SNJ85_06290, partial [Cyanobacteriota bacterium]